MTAATHATVISVISTEPVRFRMSNFLPTRLKSIELWAVGLFVWASIAGNLGLAGERTKPNVLLIAVDDLKPLLGCYGDPVVKSPNIDRLAARGVRFERAYCNQAVCAPSRNSLLTGVRPTTLGIYDLGTNFRIASSNAVTLPQYFMRHGYRTEALGKIFHVGHGNHDDAASWSVPLFQAKSIAYALPENQARLTREEALFANEASVGNLPRGAAWESAEVPDETYPDGKIAQEAIRRLQAARRKPTEPFLLAVGFLKPHLPFCVPTKYWDLYDRASFILPTVRTAPQGAPKYAPSGWGELRQYSDIPDSGPLTDDQARTMLHGYYAAVSYVDAQIGRVLDELDRLGLTSNTIILLWGDHGWHLGDHGWWCKHTNYEQATRVPLIVSAPGVTSRGARATRALIESVDIYPTLVELAGLPAPSVPQGTEGKSFVRVLRNPRRGFNEQVYHVYPRGERLGRAVRTDRYRLVEWKIPGAPAESAEFELYDYRTDPGETRNLAREQPDTLARLRVHLARLPEAKPQIVVARPLTPKQKQDRTVLFEKKDKNRDDRLTRAEFLAGQPDPDQAPKRFERFDTNKDGSLSRDEFVFMGANP
jgi:iduronate 2-sulfatase